MITWAVGSPATRPTVSGWCRTSRRCSTTRPGCSRSYVRGWQVTGNPDYLHVAERIIDYVGSELASPAGRPLLGRGCRLRREWRASSTSGPRRRSPRRWGSQAAGEVSEWFGVTPGRQLRGIDHPAAAARRSPHRPARDGGGAAAAVRVPEPSRAPRTRRQGADRVERHVLLCTGRGRGGQPDDPTGPSWLSPWASSSGASSGGPLTGGGCGHGRQRVAPGTWPTPPTTRGWSTASLAWASSPVSPSGPNGRSRPLTA